MSRAGPAVTVLVVLLLGATFAWGHAQLMKSSLARGAVVSRPPTRVQLWFNEDLEPAFSRLSVWDGHGTQVDAVDAVVGPEDPRRLSVGLPELPPGQYTVRFRVLSVDGHVVESQFTFRIRGAR